MVGLLTDNCAIDNLWHGTSLIIQVPVFIQTYTQQPLTLYQIETARVPVIDQNREVHFHTHIQVDRPYMALNSETYITIRQQDLRTCKRKGYEFYCKQLYMVKHKSKCNCESMIHFDLDSEIIKENYQFHFTITK